MTPTPRQVLTMKELHAIVENWSDDEDEIDTVTVLPPDRVDYVTDEEQFDENNIPLNDDVNKYSRSIYFSIAMNVFTLLFSQVSAMCEVAGSFEYSTTKNQFEDQLPIGAEVEIQTETYDTNAQNNEAEKENCGDDEVSTSRKRMKRSHPQEKQLTAKYKPLNAFGIPKWTTKRDEDKQFMFNLASNDQLLENMQKELCERIKNHSPIELFDLFFDDEVLQHIIHQTNLYAQQQNTN